MANIRHFTPQMWEALELLDPDLGSLEASQCLRKELDADSARHIVTCTNCGSGRIRNSGSQAS